MHKLQQYLLGIFLLLPNAAFAAEGDATLSFIPSGNVAGCDFASGQIHAECIPIYIAHILQVIFSLTGGICLIVLMVGGFQYTLGRIAGGKEKGIATITWGIIGMIVSALSFVILNAIVATINP